jgi:hypothetical protein
MKGEQLWLVDVVVRQLRLKNRRRSRGAKRKALSLAD